MNRISKQQFLLRVLFGIVLSISITRAQNIKPPDYADEMPNEVSTGHYLNRARNEEFLLDSNIVYVPTGSVWRPSVAFDGMNYFVVWCDKRIGFFRDIYGTRFSPGITDLFSRKKSRSLMPPCLMPLSSFF